MLFQPNSLDHKQVTLRSLLQSYRKHATSPRELGTLFENLVMDYLTNDPLQKQPYEKV